MLGSRRLYDFWREYAKANPEVECKVCFRVVPSIMAYVDAITGDILCVRHKDLDMIAARRERGFYASGKRDPKEPRR